MPTQRTTSSAKRASAAVKRSGVCEATINTPRRWPPTSSGTPGSERIFSESRMPLSSSGSWSSSPVRKVSPV